MSNLDRMWIKSGVFANLSKDHRVVAMDMRGYGKSEKPHDPDAYGEHMGQDVALLAFLNGHRPPGPVFKRNAGLLQLGHDKRNLSRPSEAC